MLTFILVLGVVDDANLAVRDKGLPIVISKVKLVGRDVLDAFRYLLVKINIWYN